MFGACGRGFAPAESMYAQGTVSFNVKRSPFSSARFTKPFFAMTSSDKKLCRSEKPLISAFQICLGFCQRPSGSKMADQNSRYKKSPKWLPVTLKDRALGNVCLARARSSKRIKIVQTTVGDLRLTLSGVCPSASVVCGLGARAAAARWVLRDRHSHRSPTPDCGSGSTTRTTAEACPNTARRDGGR